MASLTFDMLDKLYELSTAPKEIYDSIIKSSTSNFFEPLVELVVNFNLFHDKYSSEFIHSLVTDIKKAPVASLLRSRRTIQDILSTIFIEALHTELLYSLFRYGTDHESCSDTII